ncbi:hypothetical protein DLJ82_7041 (plasmid) [Rhizobium leguminosarum]|uniref:Uncharacterized protein n=1 Tax=Rhizobium leguminosarum TaxID=384 RepID=A0A2Z4YUU3_RHILE|nr:hypothetical protein DLJ82_7041 [Rhizobium leguminosarum]
MMTPSSSDDRKRPLRHGPVFSWAKTKKPAAGGGAAGFRKKPNDSWEEECCHSTDDPGRRMGACISKGRGRRCIASIEIIILISCSVDRHFFAMQLCAMRKAGGLITLLHPPDAQKQSARSGGSRRWHSLEDAGSNLPLAGDGRAGDVADFAAADAEVVQFACGHTTQFSDRLTVLAPVIERACYVHDDPLSWAFEAQLPVLGASFASMSCI